MGLRIATDITALIALQHLRSSSTAFRTASERIASGKRINSAADDPAGSFRVSRFRAQVASLNQASTNIQLAKSFIDTADGGLAQIQTQLSTVRTLILGARSDTTLTAINQTSIDTALDALNAIASNTAFGRQLQLNGLAGYVTTAVDGSIAQLSLRRVFFDSATTSRTFSISITAAASAGTLSIGDFGSSSGSITVTGNLGASTIKITPGTDVSGAINAVRDFTGVFASGGAAFTEGFGSAERVTIAVASGTGFTGTAGSDTGVDVAGTVEGASTSGDGRTLRLSSSLIAADVTFTSVTVGATLAFTVLDSGNEFRIGAVGNANDSLQFGIDAVNDFNLGGKPITVKGEAVGGFLDSLRGGGANALGGDIGNALRIIDESIDQVAAQRAFLGTISANTLTPQSNAISTAVIKVTAARSFIEDADIAAEAINQSIALNLFNSAKAVVAQSNALSNSVLSLLTPASRIV